MKNTFKKLTLCVLALTAVIMSSAAVKSISGTGENNAPGQKVSLAAADKSFYCCATGRAMSPCSRMTGKHRRR